MPKMSLLSKKGAKKTGQPWLWNHLLKKLGKRLILTTICTSSLVCIVNKTLKSNKNFKISFYPKKGLFSPKQSPNSPNYVPQKWEKTNVLSSMNYTETSFQRYLFENILAIYITCVNTYYKHNTSVCYTVKFIENN